MKWITKSAQKVFDQLVTISEIGDDEVLSQALSYMRGSNLYIAMRCRSADYDAFINNVVNNMKDDAREAIAFMDKVRDKAGREGQ